MTVIHWPSGLNGCCNNFPDCNFIHFPVLLIDSTLNRLWLFYGNMENLLKESYCAYFSVVKLMLYCNFKSCCCRVFLSVLNIAYKRKKSKNWQGYLLGKPLGHYNSSLTGRVLFHNEKKCQFFKTHISRIEVQNSYPLWNLSFSINWLPHGMFQNLRHMQKYFLGNGISEKSLILKESKREGGRKRETP